MFPLQGFCETALGVPTEIIQFLEYCENSQTYLDMSGNIYSQIGNSGVPCAISTASLFRFGQFVYKVVISCPVSDHFVLLQSRHTGCTITTTIFLVIV